MSKLAALSASTALLVALALGGPANAGRVDRSGVRNADRYEISAQQRVRKQRAVRQRTVRRDRTVTRQRIARRGAVVARVGVGPAGPGAYYPFLGYQAVAYPGYRPYYVWDYPLFAATSLAFLPFAAVGGTLN
jgi:hypothetical protein